MQLYMESMCAGATDEGMNESSSTARVATSSCSSDQEVRSTRSGCPQWEVPRVGTPAPEVQRMGYTSTA